MGKLKTTLLRLGFLFIFFFALIKHVEAQQVVTKPLLIISIKDSLTNTLLTSVEIALQKQQGATKRYVTNTGELTISSLDMGIYQVSFTKTGYRSLDTTIQIGNNVPNKLNVFLPAATMLLRTVDIVSKKSLVDQDLDKIIYNVKNDPSSANNNLYHLVTKIPLMSLSGNEQVQLKGSQNFTVLVNGKRSSLFNNDPTLGFKILQASNVDKVEVYTVPPARFDSEGLTGVINIITKKPTAGYAGNINGDLATNNSDVGGQFTYKEGKIGLSVSAYGYDQYPPETEHMLQRAAATGQNSFLLSEHGRSRNKVKLGYGSFEFTLEPDSLNLISISASGNLRKTNQSKYFTDQISGELLQKYDYQLDNVQHDKNGDIGISYQRNFKHNKIRQLNTSYQYTSNGNESTGNTQYLNELNYDRPDLLQNNHTSFKGHTIQLDYVQPVKMMTIEAGGKAIFRRNKSMYDYTQTSSQNNSFFENRDFSDNHEIFGLYGSLRYKKGKWGVKIGVRTEATRISNRDYHNSEAQFHRNYFNVIPGVSLQRKLSPSETFTLGFTQRIQRPGIWQLNPFTDKSNPNAYLSGNTNLKPVLNNVFELSYRNTGKVTFILGGDYSFATNTIQRVITYSSDSVSRSMCQNIGKNANLGLSLSLNASLSERFDLSLNSRVFYTRLQGELAQQKIKNSGLQGNATLFANYRFNNTTNLNTNLGFTSEAILLQGSTNAFIYHVINFNKQIPKIKTTLSAGVTNPFNKYRTLTSYLDGVDFSQTSVDRINSQIFKLSINYQFGKMKPAREVKRIIENDDLKRDSEK